MSDVASRGRRRLRLAVSFVLVAAAVALVVWNTAFRGIEASLFAPLAGFVVASGNSGTSGTILYVGLGRTTAFGLQITGECTTAVLLVPVLLVVTMFTLFTRIPLGRVALALLTATLALLLVNAVRVAIIAYSTWHWGVDPGFRISHVMVGSAFAMVGFAGSMILAVWVLVHGRSGDLGAGPINAL